MFPLNEVHHLGIKLCEGQKVLSKICTFSFLFQGTCVALPKSGKQVGECKSSLFEKTENAFFCCIVYLIALTRGNKKGYKEL